MEKSYCYCIELTYTTIYNIYLYIHIIYCIMYTYIYTLYRCIYIWYIYIYSEKPSVINRDAPVPRNRNKKPEAEEPEQPEPTEPEEQPSEAVEVVQREREQFHEATGWECDGMWLPPKGGYYKKEIRFHSQYQSRTVLIFYSRIGHLHRRASFGACATTGRIITVSEDPSTGTVARNWTSTTLGTAFNRTRKKWGTFTDHIGTKRCDPNVSSDSVFCYFFHSYGRLT